MFSTELKARNLEEDKHLLRHGGRLAAYMYSTYSASSAAIHEAPTLGIALAW